MAANRSGVYVPERGDIVLLDFHSGKGCEIGKRRPALVLSSRLYNEAIGQAICIPIRSLGKKRPANVEISGLDIEPSFAIPGLIRTLDWQHRRAERVGHVDEAVYKEAILKLLPLIGAETFLD